jgi:N-methylhydantoinase B
MSTQTDWRTNGYLPGEHLDIDPRLKLHDEADTEVDAVTFEVIRYNLWNTNIEHGQTMVNVSGSPVAAFAHDFNPTILTHDGEYVFYGPYIQFLSSSLDLTVKWILENRSWSPGIAEGDVWISNDVWVGATHQSDIVVCAPVFWEGKLFCWVANTMHQFDLGGTTPGGFATDATQTYEESLMFPPMKLVSEGAFQDDVEDMITRSSRMAPIVALDLRAEVAGCNVAAKRVRQLVERHGPSLVKGVMNGIIDRSESSFVEKLARIPDGTWRERGYVDGAFTGDRKAHPIVVEVTKRGDELIFSNHGTGDEAGSINMAIGGWRGAIINAVTQALGYDQLFAVGGLIKHLRFEPEPGTMTTAEYPNAVSCAPTAMQFVLTLMGNCLGRMMSSDEVLGRDVAAGGSCSFSPITTISGVAEDGSAQGGTLLLDLLLGGLGAFSHRDGIPTGGVIWDPIGRAPGIEQTESSYPLLYLYRRQLTDSGGSGKFARGNSASLAVIPHRTTGLRHDVASQGTAVPSSLGLFGGRPGGTNRMVIWRQTKVRELLDAGVIPTSREEVSPREIDVLAPRAAAVPQGLDDVFELQICGGAGYGDPLERDPELVAEDVGFGLVSEEAAAEIYGVALSGGAADAEATRSIREERRRRRIGEAGSNDDSSQADGTRLATIGEYLAVWDGSGEAELACGHCDRVLGPLGANYKLASNRDAVPIQGAGPFLDPAYALDAEVELREYSCPGCGMLFDAEVALVGDQPLHDIELAEPPRR